MKIAISSQGDNLDSQVDARFGRCNYFIIIDSETGEFEAVSNQASGAMGGAGIQSAQTVADKDVKAVITGNVGPNAFQTLKATDIKIYGGASGTVGEAIEKYKKGELQEFSDSSVPGHFGMGKL